MLITSRPSVHSLFPNCKIPAEHHHQGKTSLGNRQKFDSSFQLIADHEQMLAEHLLQYLLSKPEIRIIGHTIADQHKRVPTISFIHEKYKSSAVTKRVDQFDIGIRFGDFYAKKIIEYLGLVEKDGVIRVSLVHYNTIEEVDQLIEAFETIF